MATVFAAGLLAMVAAGAGSAPLAPYVDRARVVVVSAPAPADAAFERQTEDLGRDAAGLRTRDLIVIRALGSGSRAEAIRRSVQLPEGRFGVALVGKDGGVKVRSPRPVTCDQLFRTIDAMPMRRAEVRRRNRG